MLEKLKKVANTKVTVPTIKKTPQALKDAPQKLKGFRDIDGSDYYQFQAMFEKAQEIAIYYGFKPLDVPMLERTEVFTGTIGEGTDIVDKEMYSFRTRGGDHVTLRPEFTAPIMRAYLENGMQSLPQPVMVYSYGSCFRHERPQRGRLREFKQFDLEILGTEKSIADATVIRTLIDILEEYGFKELVVDINSMGDKDSRTKYLKELTNYYKKHQNKVCTDCRERLKINPLRLLDCKSEECQPLKEDAPRSIDFLSPEAKIHFKEVLEYLEEMEIPYRINNMLVRGFDYYTHTVFEVIQVDTDDNGNTKEITITGGGRYNYLAKRMGSKKEVPGVGTGMGFERIMMMPACKKMCPRIIKKPKVYFIHLGLEARLKSLSVIEILRKAKIPMEQSLSKDSLGSQLAIAEKMGVPYAILFGQKEAMSGEVIVRNMENRSQDTVKISELSEYIKKLH
jgi:histidyl-tRNA synthetase